MIRTDRTVISEKISEIDRNLKSYSVYPTDIQDLLQNTVDGYLSGFGDNYAMYLNKDQYRDYEALNSAGVAQKTPVGIGISALYDMTAQGIYIVNVYPNSPAAKAGILPGDVITHVNKSKVTEKGFYGSMAVIAGGETNIKVKLTVRKSDGTSNELEVNREVVHVENVTSRLYEGGVGIVRINEFDSKCTDHFKREVEKLITSGADRFVIDIRNNPGGTPEDVAKILDFLLPEGVVITGQDRNGNIKQYKSDVSEFTYPIVLVVNKNTICGAELFAAAMRDFKDVPLVGNTTYGKATYQQMYTFSDGSALSLSYMKYTTPDGGEFDKKGLLLDSSMEVPMSLESALNYNSLNDSDDQQLMAAVKVASEMEYTGPNNS